MVFIDIKQVSAILKKKGGFNGSIELFGQLGLLYRKRRIELKIKLRTLALRCGSP